jgi:hypothetical protein
VLLQESSKRLQLRGQQKGDRQGTDAFGEVLAEAFFFCKRVAHGISTTEEKDRGQITGSDLSAGFFGSNSA